MALVKLVPSLLIDAIISVFNVGVSTFSSNTTIRDVVGTVVDENDEETIITLVTKKNRHPVYSYRYGNSYEYIGIVT